MNQIQSWKKNTYSTKKAHTTKHTRLHLFPHTNTHTHQMRVLYKKSDGTFFSCFFLNPLGAMHIEPNVNPSDLFEVEYKTKKKIWKQQQMRRSKVEWVKGRKKNLYHWLLLHCSCVRETLTLNGKWKEE